MSKSKKYLVMLALALGQGAVYFLPYIRNVYYAPLVETLGVTNAQFGSLVSFFAIGCMILYIPGGIMSDKWNYKRSITISLYATAALVASFAFFMNFTYARVVFFLLALSTTFVFWSSTLKAVRMIGKSDEQGKTYGIFYAMQGILSIVVQSGILAVYNLFPDQAFGLRVVLLINAGINLAAGLACQFFLPSPEHLAQERGEGSGGGFQFKMVGQVLRNPLIWLIALLIFCAYGLYSNSYYFSSYLTEVKGLDFNFGAQLSLIRVTYMMCVASLIGGFIADKLKSTTRWYIICAAGAAASCVLFVTLSPTGVSPVVLGVISILPAAFMLMVYGLTSSLYEEYHIPMAVTGTAIGIVSIIGYTPDLLFGPILGGMLDRQGADGYLSIFIFFAALGVIGLLGSVLAMFLNKKRRKGSAPAEF